jgi:hypothetical protein
MANNFSSNTQRKLIRAFLEEAVAARVVSRSFDTQIFEGKFDPRSGTTVDIKRPHSGRAIKTADGDMTGQLQDITSGKATATVQQMYTAAVELKVIEQALETDQLREMLRPYARQLITQMELDYANFIAINSNLSYGTPGTAVDAWTDVAGANALMDTLGVPNDGDRVYIMSPWQATNLSAVQLGLNQDPRMIRTAWENAVVTDRIAGLKVLSATTLPTITTGANADRSGTIVGSPTATYLAAKDTMTQSIAVTAFSAAGVIKAGEIIEVTTATRTRRNLATRQTALDGTGTAIRWRGVVTADVTLGASGEGTLVVAGPAIFEANGAYNTITSALGNGDVITVLGATATAYQPAIFGHKQAFSLATVPLPEIKGAENAQEAIDNMTIRMVSQGSALTNKNIVRFDLLPAFAALNPFYAGQGFGV